MPKNWFLRVLLDIVASFFAATLIFLLVMMNSFKGPVENTIYAMTVPIVLGTTAIFLVIINSRNMNRKLIIWGLIFSGLMLLVQRDSIVFDPSCGGSLGLTAYTCNTIDHVLFTTYVLLFNLICYIMAVIPLTIYLQKFHKEYKKPGKIYSINFRQY